MLIKKIPSSIGLVKKTDYEKITQTQQIFVLMKTTWRRLSSSSSRRLHDVLIKTNIFVLVIRFQDVFKTFSKHLQDVLQKRIQDIFKTSSRRFQNIFMTSCKDVFKTYHQVKLLLLTRLQEDLEMYSIGFWDVLQWRFSTEGFGRSHICEIYCQCIKIARVIKISEVLVFHFTTPFSSCLQKGI